MLNNNFFKKPTLFYYHSLPMIKFLPLRRYIISSKLCFHRSQFLLFLFLKKRGIPAFLRWHFHTLLFQNNIQAIKWPESSTKSTIFEIFHSVCTAWILYTIAKGDINSGVNILPFWLLDSYRMGYLFPHGMHGARQIKKSLSINIQNF